MTEIEIIKAVESCLQLTEECGVCPLQENTHCHELLLAELKKLLNSYKEIIKSHEKAEHFAEKTIEAQEKEIEKLNVELVGMRGACESYKIHYAKAQTKLEKLQSAWKEYTSKTKYCIEVLQTQLAQAKSEAYREFVMNALRRIGFREHPNAVVRGHINKAYEELTRNLHGTCTESNE